MVVSLVSWNKELLAAIPNDDVIFLFHNMGKDRRVEL
jgi:hypothetical protein